MDLSRAKVVLIVAFLILNLFLLYQIVEKEGMDNPALFGGEEAVTRMEAALQEANLTLDVNLPRSGMRAAYLVVEPWQSTLEEVAEMLWRALENEEDPFPFDSIVTTENHENNTMSYTFGSYELFFDQEEFFSLVGAFEGLSPDELKQVADDFTKRLSFPGDFVYDYREGLNMETVLHYRQEFEGFPLYAGYMRFHHHRDSGVEIRFHRLEPLGFGERRREVIPPNTALWRFLDAYTADGRVSQPTSVVDFTLGYYSEEYDAQLWEIPPVWRIRLLNEEVYYINAFTGYHEKS